METAYTMDAGEYVSDTWGHYAPAQAVRTMLGTGWAPAGADALGLVADTYLAMLGPSTLQDHLPAGWAADAYDTLADASDDAAEWATTYRAPEGHYFGWEDGAFGCWTIPEE